MKWFIAFLLLLALLVGYWGWPLFALRGRTANVRFGSKADISACPRDVRFAPKSGRGLAGAIWAPVTLLTSIGAGRSSRRAARQARAGQLRHGNRSAIKQP